MGIISARIQSAVHEYVWSSALPEHRPVHLDVELILLPGLDRLLTEISGLDRNDPRGVSCVSKVSFDFMPINRSKLSDAVLLFGPW